MDFSIVTEIAGIASSISLAVIAVILIINAIEKFQFNKKIKAYYDLEKRYKELVKRDEEEMMRILLIEQRAQEIFDFLVSKQTALTPYKKISLSYEYKCGHFYPQLSFEDRHCEVKVIKCNQRFRYNVRTGEVK